jgi:hypothetical protein
MVPFMIMWKNIVESDKPHVTIWRIAGYLRLQTHTHTEYVIHIAFTLQQWLHERASTLRYMCIACLVTTEESVYWNVRAESL